MPGDRIVTRFAPSTTGPAHPGTLLSALLCWLEARSADGHVFLRLEDLDPDRSSPERVTQMVRHLEWLGLDWDRIEQQSQHDEQHRRVLDDLNQSGLLYACSCSRSDVRRRCPPAADGGFVYDGKCRPPEPRPLPGTNPGGPLRLRLPDRIVSPTDRAGLDLAMNPAAEMGDPVLVRRDGAIAYHLAAVADDSVAGVNLLVRGRDLAASAAVQALIYDLIASPVPQYWHHFLFLEATGGKLAKLHGAVGADELSGRYSAEELCGLLACWSGLLDAPQPCRPRDLVSNYVWRNVVTADQVLAWDGQSLRLDNS